MNLDPGDRPPEPFGQFELLRPLGAGGMAEVFCARARGPGGFERLIVIKRILPHLSLDPQFTEMFVHEAKLSGLLCHGNIVQVYEFGEIDGRLFIAMEYVHGTDLRALMRACATKKVRIPTDLAVHIAAEMLRGLAYAHAKRALDRKHLGLVHRDISPSNILLSSEGQVKLCDFGIAKASTSLTTVGWVKGKLSYMAPEQTGLGSVDARADLFGVGVILWEMLAGERLFGVDSPGRRATDRARPLPPLEVPDEGRLRAVVSRALEVNPDRRVPDAETFLRELPAVADPAACVAALRDIAARLAPTELCVPEHGECVRPDGAPRPAAGAVELEVFRSSRTRSDGVTPDVLARAICDAALGSRPTPAPSVPAPVFALRSFADQQTRVAPPTMSVGRHALALVTEAETRVAPQSDEMTATRVRAMPVELGNNPAPVALCATAPAIAEPTGSSKSDEPRPAPGLLVAPPLFGTRLDAGAALFEQARGPSGWHFRAGVIVFVAAMAAIVLLVAIAFWPSPQMEIPVSGPRPAVPTTPTLGSPGRTALSESSPPAISPTGTSAEPVDPTSGTPVRPPNAPPTRPQKTRPNEQRSADRSANDRAGPSGNPQSSDQSPEVEPQNVGRIDPDPEPRNVRPPPAEPVPRGSTLEGIVDPFSVRRQR